MLCSGEPNCGIHVLSGAASRAQFFGFLESTGSNGEQAHYVVNS